MVSAEIKDLKIFEEFLSVANKFVQQGQLIINKEKTSLFCKNPQDFSTSKLMLDTNSMKLSSNTEIDEIRYCIKDINSLKSALSIISQVENVNECIVELENVPSVDGEIYAKTIRYKGTAKFKLISIDPAVIEKYITNELKTELSEDWKFTIDPINLDILQNKTGNIVNTTNDVSIYIYPDPSTKKVMVDLNTRQTDYMNSIALPIANSYEGELNNKMNEVAIHESAFRLFNILKVKENLNCFFTSKYNIFFISSEVKKGDYYIKSRLMNQIIKGK